MNKEELELKVREDLFNLQDLKYKDFVAKLIPNIDKESIIGVRSPILKNYYKDFKKNSYKDDFLKLLPHKYLEENGLHMLLLNDIKDIDLALNSVMEFLPYINNWATCDSFNNKAFKKNKDLIYEKIKEWVESSHPYTQRFAVGLLMNDYLDEDFKEEHLKLVSKIKSEDYYVNMGIAWYYSYAIIKQYDKTLPLFISKTLDKWIHNKSIQKAVESQRIDSQLKTYLKTLKIK